MNQLSFSQHAGPHKQHPAAQKILDMQTLCVYRSDLLF